MKYVYHVHLRDTNKKAFQVRVGQGDIEYGRIIGQLQKLKYNRALTVNIAEQEGVDHVGELRKLRLLLGSLLSRLPRAASLRSLPWADGGCRVAARSCGVSIIFWALFTSWPPASRLRRAGRLSVRQLC